MSTLKLLRKIFKELKYDLENFFDGTEMTEDDLENWEGHVWTSGSIQPLMKQLPEQYGIIAFKKAQQLSRIALDEYNEEMERELNSNR